MWCSRIELDWLIHPLASTHISELKDLSGLTTLATYTYDGAGLRVKKVAGSTTTRYIFSGTKVIAEYDNGALPTVPTREYVYAGSQLLATLSNTGVPTYHHADQLSARVTTDAQGAKLGEQGHYPFGDSWYSLNSTTKWQFTSYERDNESGLDYAMFRYDSSRLGRFLTPDPLAGGITNPQSLNRYTYVVNNPTNLIDPLGLCEPGCTCSTGPNGEMIISCPAPMIAPIGIQLANAGLGGSGACVDVFIDGAYFGNTCSRTPSGEGLFDCAARNANELSLASLSGTQNVPILGAVLSNTFSTITNLVQGQQLSSAALQGAAALSSQGVNASSKLVSAAEVSPGTLSILKPVPAITLGQTAAGAVLSTAAKGLSTALNFLTVAQLSFDAGVFAAALGECLSGL